MNKPLTIFDEERSRFLSIEVVKSMALHIHAVRSCFLLHPKHGGRPLHPIDSANAEGLAAFECFTRAFALPYSPRFGIRAVYDELDRPLAVRFPPVIAAQVVKMLIDPAILDQHFVEHTMQLHNSVSACFGRREFRGTLL